MVKGANKKPLFSVSIENLTIGFKAQEDKQDIVDFCVSFPLPHAQIIKNRDCLGLPQTPAVSLFSMFLFSLTLHSLAELVEDFRQS